MWNEKNPRQISPRVWFCGLIPQDALYFCRYEIQKNMSNTNLHSKNRMVIHLHRYFSFHKNAVTQFGIYIKDATPNWNECNGPPRPSLPWHCQVPIILLLCLLTLSACWCHSTTRLRARQWLSAMPLMPKRVSLSFLSIYLRLLHGSRWVATTPNRTKLPQLVTRYFFDT